MSKVNKVNPRMLNVLIAMSLLICMSVVISLELRATQPYYEGIHAVENPKLALIGILTAAEKQSQRALIRHYYNLQSKPEIDFKFVIARSKTPVWNELVHIENKIYGDMMVLNMEENMNEGKTFEYFKTAGRLYPYHYRYVMKADDDTFINFAALIPYLESLPETGTYFGKRFYLPQYEVAYMQGMAYGLSADLVQNMVSADYEIAKGWEDFEMGKWAQNYTLHFASDEAGDYYHQPQHDSWW